MTAPAGGRRTRREARTWQIRQTELATRGQAYQSDRARRTVPMKTNQKKQWIKPSMKDVMIFFECTCYSGAV